MPDYLVITAGEKSCECSNGSYMNYDMKWYCNATVVGTNIKQGNGTRLDLNHTKPLAIFLSTPDGLRKMTHLHNCVIPPCLRIL